jgi:hypothetical protein
MIIKKIREKVCSRLGKKSIKAMVKNQVIAVQ